MTLDLLLVLALLTCCVALFVRNKPRMDVVAVLAMVALPLLGILTVPEALAGFSDPSVVLIAALFIIGDGLVRTPVSPTAWATGWCAPPAAARRACWCC